MDVNPYTPEIEPYLKQEKIDDTRVSSATARTLNLFFDNDPDIANLDRKYGTNLVSIGNPENEDIFKETVEVTMPKIKEAISPIMSDNNQAVEYITERLDKFYEEEKDTPYWRSKAKEMADRLSENPDIDNSKLPNPFLTETVFPKYELTLEDLRPRIETAISMSTVSHIDPVVKKDDKTITVMSQIPNSTPMIIIPDSDVREITKSKLTKETSLEKWQVELSKARKDKESAITQELPNLIKEFGKIGLEGLPTDRLPTSEEINKAITDRQLKITNRRMRNMRSTKRETLKIKK